MTSLSLVDACMIASASCALVSLKMVPCTYIVHLLCAIKILVLIIFFLPEMEAFFHDLHPASN